MYENAEVIIRLNGVEVQQALAIWLDDDAQQAIRFLKEKVVDKTVRAVCKRSASTNSKMTPCHLVGSNCSCCRAAGVGRVRKSIFSS